MLRKKAFGDDSLRRPFEALKEGERSLTCDVSLPVADFVEGYGNLIHQARGKTVTRSSVAA